MHANVSPKWPGDCLPYIVVVPKFDGNLFSTVVKYHVITDANRVRWTNFSELSQYAHVWFSFEDIRNETWENVK